MSALCRDESKLALGKPLTCHFVFLVVELADPGELDLSENPLGAAGAKELAKLFSH